VDRVLKMWRDEIDLVVSTFGNRIDVLYHISVFHPGDFDRCQREKSMIHLRAGACGYRSGESEEST
jgi:hypothetical protein